MNVVDLIGTHSYLGDLTFTLTSPNNTSVILVAEQCSEEANFNINFDDQAATGNLPCPYNDGGTYISEEALSAFNGENPQGDWTLTVEDNANFDGGALESWALIICAEGLADVSFNASPNTAELCSGNEVTFNLTAGQDFEGPITLAATSNPAGATIDFATNPINAGGTVQATVSNLTMGGTVEVNFTATADGITSTETVTIDVETAPSTPDLLTPIQNATSININPQLIWEDITNADGYIIEVATDFNFMNIVYSETEVNANHTISMTLDNETTYYWRIQSENGCGASVTAPFNFTTGVNGINDLDGNAISIQPNPTHGLVTVQLARTLPTDISVEVFGINGQLLQNTTLNSGATNLLLDLQNYPEGVYLLKMQSQNDSFVRRIILQ